MKADLIGFIVKPEAGVSREGGDDTRGWDPG